MPITDFPEVSTKNTTNVPLGSGDTFTGEWEQTPHGEALVMCKTDNNGTLYFDFSPDGLNVDSTFPVNGFSVVADTSEVHRAVKAYRFFRVRLVKDTGAQTYLRLFSYYGNFGLLSAPINQSLSNDSDAIIAHVISDETDYITGKFALDRFIRPKFGFNLDIDTTTDPEDNHAAGGVYAGFPTSGSAETITVTSSAGASDAGATMFIYGLDTDKLMQSETITLNGSGVGVTVGTYKRSSIGYVIVPASGQVSNAGDLTATNTTTTANVFWTIPAGYGQTQNVLDTVPAGYTGYIRALRSTMSDNTTNEARMGLWTRKEGEAVRIKFPFSMTNSQPYTPNLYGGFELPEKTDFSLRCLLVGDNDAAIFGGMGILYIKN